MLVSMSDKELKRLSVLQEICDQRITQSQAAQLLHISERQIRRLLQKYKAQGPVALKTKNASPSLRSIITVYC
jgi:DNA-binding transcriptional regulator LsrR (DeoR family)